jgi:hypothetical protein
MTRQRAADACASPEGRSSSDVLSTRPGLTPFPRVTDNVAAVRVDDIRVRSASIAT